MKHIRLFLAICCLAVAMTSCHKSVVYSRFAPVSSGQWHMDSVMRFDYHIADTSVQYKMTLYIRHTENYPYQNMWLFVGDSVPTDTIRFFLADDRGRWLGDRNNGLYEVPFVFGEQLHFVDTGTYHLAIQHGLRDTLLRGVMDVGVEIVKE